MFIVYSPVWWMSTINPMHKVCLIMVVWAGINYSTMPKTPCYGQGKLRYDNPALLATDRAEI
jgi:hypothetical protein